jgi:hypothetical protein
VDVTKADLQRYAETYLKEQDGIALAKAASDRRFFVTFQPFFVNVDASCSAVLLILHVSGIGDRVA